MLFSSLVFIWYFFPIVFIGYFLVPKKFRNVFLLIASLFFYAWGEPRYILLMLLSIAMNYLFGLFVAKEEQQGKKKWLLAICVIGNLGLLGYFKYYDFFVRIVNAAFRGDILAIKNIVLPIGISFYTFQALSYVVDVYRKDIKVQKNILNLALYISFFPQLIAGPIVKYYEIENQMEHREISLQKISHGMKRFTIGLGKKVIFANAFAQVVDEVFVLPAHQLSPLLIWLTLLLYALQIYYDFSGYSDMAIGLGKMFGFDFLENFNYPYIASSIQDFWRRWHISLSTWFREYLYIPLGGNRKGRYRTYLNLAIVFFATGLWHGASYNYVIWGLYHGFFLIIERWFLGDILKKKQMRYVRHIYTVVIVLFGWLLFRVESMRTIAALLIRMVSPASGLYTWQMFIDMRVILLMIFGILFCGILQNTFKKVRQFLYDEECIYWHDIFGTALILMYCTLLLVCNTYNPFIYFRF